MISKWSRAISTTVLQVLRLLCDVEAQRQQSIGVFQIVKGHVSASGNRYYVVPGSKGEMKNYNK